MNRIRKYLPHLTAALVGAAMLVAPSQARAVFEMRISTDGGATWGPTLTDGGTGLIFTMADSLAITAQSTNFLSTGMSTLDLQVGGTQAAKTYKLLVQATVTDVPTTPPPQSLSWKYTSSSGGNLTELAEGWIDQGNNPFGGPNPVGADTGSLTAPANGSLIFSAVPPYSWTAQFSMTGNGILGDQTSSDFNQKIVPTPAPAGLVLAFTGMPVFGFAAWRRKRSNAAKA